MNRDSRLAMLHVHQHFSRLQASFRILIRGTHHYFWQIGHHKNSQPAVYVVVEGREVLRILYHIFYKAETPYKIVLSFDKAESSSPCRGTWYSLAET